MSAKNQPSKNARPVRRSLVLEVLHDLDSESEFDLGLHYERSPGTDSVNTASSDFAASATSLEETIKWLEYKIEAEQARAEAVVDLEAERLNREANQRAVPISCTVQQTMVMQLLERIQRGEGPRDVVFEDLLAPLRRGGVGRTQDADGVYVAETYDDMKQVLLAWNRRVAGSYEDEEAQEAREALLDVLEERLKAEDKVLDIVGDEKASSLYDAVGQAAILEPSTRRLRLAMHAYRPETATFEDQDPFHLLVMLLANICCANPDVRDDVELIYMTVKVLAAEKRLVWRFEDAAFRQKLERRRESARQRRNSAAIQHLNAQQDEYDKRACRKAIQETIDQIKRARKELSKIVIDKQLEQTVLQAGQKCAATKLRDQDPNPPWPDIHTACAEADTTLDRLRRQDLEDLDVSAKTACTNLRGMRDIHAKALTRALKFAGQDLKTCDEATRQRIVEERKNEPVTARMMSETFSGVLETRRAAKQMVRQVEVMEVELEELLGAARRQYREYDGLVRLINGDISLSDVVDEKGKGEEDSMEMGSEGVEKRGSGGLRRMRSSSCRS